MICNCRYSVTNGTFNCGQHLTVANNYRCFCCGSDKNEWLVDQSILDLSLECNNCHNHIKYIYTEDLYAEDFYFENLQVSIAYDENMFYLYRQDILIAKLQPFKFDTIERLKSKIKTYITFS